MLVTWPSTLRRAITCDLAFQGKPVSDPMRNYLSWWAPSALTTYSRRDPFVKRHATDKQSSV
jgi:hypothetical protein